ncbi:MAG: hypothetical protein OXF79_09040 [Chloroflexi bacterium]|nr:hypothetical protein [Chloroflexota bacterium]
MSLRGPCRWLRFLGQNAREIGAAYLPKVERVALSVFLVCIAAGFTGVSPFASGNSGWRSMSASAYVIGAESGRLTVGNVRLIRLGFLT